MLRWAKPSAWQNCASKGTKRSIWPLCAQAGRKLNIEGEDAKGVISGVDFLRRVNLGEDLKLNGRVLVIGGGNVAIDVARTAVRTGAEKVELVCLETREQMPLPAGRDRRGPG